MLNLISGPCKSLQFPSMNILKPSVKGNTNIPSGAHGNNLAKLNDQENQAKLEETLSIFDQHEIGMKHVTNDQAKHLQNMISSRCAVYVAKAVQTTPSVLFNIKKSMIDSISAQTKNLCKKKEGSKLYAPGYKDLAEYEIPMIWLEMTQNTPLLVDIMSAVCGLKCGFNEVPVGVKEKFCFIYSILMNQRWSALSLMQRVNTVLMIQGGGSRDVSTY